MAVRTKELGHKSGATANTLHLIYTCPVGKTAIIKDVCVECGGAGIVQVTILRGTDQGRVFRASMTAGQWLASAPRFCVMEPADELYVLWTVTSTTHHVWVSGTELDGVA